MRFYQVVFLAVGILFISFGQSYISTVLPRGDEYHYLVTAKSITKDHDIWLENNYEESIDPHYVKGRDGHYYLYHGLGLFPILLSIPYAIAQRAGVTFVLSVLYTLLLYLLFVFSFKLTKRKLLSLISILLVGFSIPLASFSFLTFPEISAALAVTLVTYLFYKKQNSSFLYIAIGLLPWTHLRFLPLAALFLVISIQKYKFSKKTMISTVMLAAYFFFLYYIYGSVNPTKPYTDLGIPTNSGNLLQNLVLVLVDKQYGLLTHSPYYLAGFAGLFLLKNRRLAFATILVSAVTVFRYYDWHGGYSPPARYLVSTLPFLVLGLSVFLARSNMLGKIFVLFTGIYSLYMWSALTTKAGNWGFIYYDGYHPIFLKISEQYTLGFYQLMPSYYLGRIFHTGHFVLFLLCLALGVFLYLFGVKKTKKLN